MSKKFLTESGVNNLISAISEWVRGRFASKSKAGSIKLGDGLRQHAGATDGTVEIDSVWLNNILQDYKTFVVVTTLPDTPAAGNEGKIHIVPDSTRPKSGTKNNVCKEYVWRGASDGWELIGSFSAADIDLSAYVTTAKLESEAADGHAYTPTVDALLSKLTIADSEPATPTD